MCGGGVCVWGGMCGGSEGYVRGGGGMRSRVLYRVPGRLGRGRGASPAPPPPPPPPHSSGPMCRCAASLVCECAEGPMPAVVGPLGALDRPWDSPDEVCGPPLVPPSPPRVGGGGIGALWIAALEGPTQSAHKTDVRSAPPPPPPSPPKGPLRPTTVFKVTGCRAEVREHGGVHVGGPTRRSAGAPSPSPSPGAHTSDVQRCCHLGGGGACAPIVGGGPGHGGCGGAPPPPPRRTCPTTAPMPHWRGGVLPLAGVVWQGVQRARQWALAAFSVSGTRKATGFPVHLARHGAVMGRVL